MTKSNLPPVEAAELWAVHVLGPDDVHPAPDYLTAVRWANRMNAWWEGQSKDDNWPVIHAYAERYEGTPERHAEYLPASEAEFGKLAECEVRLIKPSTTPPVEAADLKRLSEAASKGRAYTCGPPWFQTGCGVLVGSPDPHAGYMIADTESWAGEREETRQDRPDCADIISTGEADAEFLAACWNFVRDQLNSSTLTDRPPPPSAPRDGLREALEAVRKIISEAAMTGFNCHDGDWAERLYYSQQQTSRALAQADTGSRGEDDHSDNRKEVMPNEAGSYREERSTGRDVTSPREEVRASGGAPAGQGYRRDREVIEKIILAWCFGEAARDQSESRAAAREAADAILALPAFYEAPPPEAGAPEDQGREGAAEEVIILQWDGSHFVDSDGDQWMMADATHTPSRREAVAGEGRPGDALRACLLGLIRLVHRDSIGRLDLTLSDVTLDGSPAGDWVVQLQQIPTLARIEGHGPSRSADLLTEIEDVLARSDPGQASTAPVPDLTAVREALDAALQSIITVKPLPSILCRAGRAEIIGSVLDALARIEGQADRPAGEREGWLPIESAPRDELLWLFEPHDLGGFQFAGCHSKDADGWVNNLDLQKQIPTHWQPLPALPAARPTPKAATGGEPELCWKCGREPGSICLQWECPHVPATSGEPERVLPDGYADDAAGSTSNKAIIDRWCETERKLERDLAHNPSANRQMAASCCSAVSPCSHQQRDPYTICKTCAAAATSGEQEG